MATVVGFAVKTSCFLEPSWLFWPLLYKAQTHYVVIGLFCSVPVETAVNGKGSGPVS